MDTLFLENLLLILKKHVKTYLDTSFLKSRTDTNLSVRSLWRYFKIRAITILHEAVRLEKDYLSRKKDGYVPFFDPRGPSTMKGHEMDAFSQTNI